ncbi:MAG: hypothetical protein SGJ04_00795 [Bacteroidota bacterium]|nr:hypothetical protein [Bacteroidota bacterium]
MRKKILILSSNLINDRVLLYNDFLEILSKDNDVYIWATSYDTPAYQNLEIENVYIQEFPKVEPMKFKYQLIRRLNDFTWDEKGLSFSRKSFWDNSDDARKTDKTLKIIRYLAKANNFFGTYKMVEKYSESLYLKEGRSPQTLSRLKKINPDLIIVQSPFRMDEPGIAAESLNAGYKTVALITSWDNISTKARFMFQYDGYFVWSDFMKKELNQFYPYTISKEIFIISAPQYDVFFKEKYVVSREFFYKSLNLNSNKKTILLALGSPNLFDEIPSVGQIVEIVTSGILGDVQLIIRAHPLHKNDAELLNYIGKYPQVAIQLPNPSINDVNFTHDEMKISEWASTFNHIELVINLASTVSIDASVLNKPVINLNFDPSGKKNKLVNDVNFKMNHFAPVTETGGLWLVNNYQELIEACKIYLENPNLHTKERRDVVELVIGNYQRDGAKQFATAVVKFLV